MIEQGLTTCVRGHEYMNQFWGECPQCQSTDNRALNDRVGVAVRALKAAMETGHEKNAYYAAKQLRELNHPDVDGLVTAIKARLDREKGGKKRGRLDDQ